MIGRVGEISRRAASFTNRVDTGREALQLRVHKLGLLRPHACGGEAVKHFGPCLGSALPYGEIARDRCGLGSGVDLDIVDGEEVARLFRGTWRRGCGSL